MAEPVEDPGSDVVASSHYVRARHAMLLRASFTPLFTDYYLHLMQHGLRLEPAHDTLLKEALAALSLHLISRPRDETVAWTVNLQQPRLNLFVTGDSASGLVTGRIYTDHVKEGADNLFYSQVLRPNHPARTSVVPVAAGDALAMAAEFHRQSQQTPAQFFRVEGEDAFALLVALPDCDLEWLEALDAAGAGAIEGREELGFLENRIFRFGCRCTLPRIVQSIASLGRASIDEIFGEDEAVEITCPRCAAKYTATRDQLRALRESGEPGEPRA
jgi:molecular chaperone Hsp33